MSIDLAKYQEFVSAVTSDTSVDLSQFTQRLQQLHNQDEINLPLLITAAIGLAAECGEFCEIPKKILFQGRALDQDSRHHMMRELGDVIWYWVNACRALNIDPNDVIRENIAKLRARYPDGTFSAEHSENRQAGDI